MIEVVATIVAILVVTYGTATVSAITTPPAAAISVIMTIAYFLGFVEDRWRWRAIILTAAIFGYSVGLVTALEIVSVVIIIALEHVLRTNLFLRRRFAGALTVATSWIFGTALLGLVRLAEGVQSVGDEPRRFIVANVWLTLAVSVVVLGVQRLHGVIYRPTI